MTLWLNAGQALAASHDEQEPAGGAAGVMVSTSNVTTSMTSACSGSSTISRSGRVARSRSASSS
ncbi:MAG: hypothetical protein LC732_06640 [Acidobacteria bacterium]|nr:hypothetical protein [Acidobacteriota bacterium]